MITLDSVISGEHSFADTIAFVEEKLIEQGRPSIDGDGTCLYRGPDGTKCGVGFLISDEQLAEAVTRWDGMSEVGKLTYGSPNIYGDLSSEHIINGMPIASILSIIGPSTVKISSFLGDLQIYHDTVGMRNHKTVEDFCADIVEEFRTLRENYDVK